MTISFSIDDCHVPLAQAAATGGQCDSSLVLESSSAPFVAAQSSECPSPQYCQMEGSCGASTPCGSSTPCGASSLCGSDTGCLTDSTYGRESACRVSQVSQRRYLCHCLRVSEDQVRESVQIGELQTVRQVISACGAGGGCMACHRHIKRVISEESANRSVAMAASYTLQTSSLSISQ